MTVSAEVRWFWEGDAPLALARWFESGPFRPGGGEEPRTDLYLREPSREIGIKARGGHKKGAEVKTIVDTLGEVRLGGLHDRVEIWTKVTVDSLHLGRVRTISTDKMRRLRMFDTSADAVKEIELGPDEEPRKDRRPDESCNVELTDVRVAEGEKHWTTLGFEASGSLATVERNLRRAIAHLAPHFPEIPHAHAHSYPAWLNTLGLLTERPDPEAIQAVLDAADDEWRRQRTAGKIFPVQWKEFED
jgi:hypothetical protein